MRRSATKILSQQINNCFLFEDVVVLVFYIARLFIARFVCSFTSWFFRSCFFFEWWVREAANIIMPIKTKITNSFFSMSVFLVLFRPFFFSVQQTEKSSEYERITCSWIRSLSERPNKTFNGEWMTTKTTIKPATMTMVTIK